VHDVLLLLFASGPLAIAGFVVSVVVDALDRVLRTRPESHVNREILVSVPAFANSDSAPSVSGVTAVVRIETSLPHVEPRAVFGGFDSTERATVPDVYACWIFSSCHGDILAEVGA
jgi:hypothetical protein